MRLIPAIDLHQGRCVRLYQGDFALETRYDVQPGALLKRYEDAGADWVHVVDLDGARSGKRENESLISELAAASTKVKLQVGGGIRSARAIGLLLARGVSRVVIGSAAVERANEVRQWIQEFGAERVCLAFDVLQGSADVPRVYTHGWARPESLSLWSALEPFGSALKHVLCTDITRDGTLAGPNVALYAEALRRFPHLNWQASGGIAATTDLEALAATGLSAAVSGRALLDERMTLKELWPFLRDALSPA